MAQQSQAIPPNSDKINAALFPKREPKVQEAWRGTLSRRTAPPTSVLLRSPGVSSMAASFSAKQAPPQAAGAGATADEGREQVDGVVERVHHGPRHLPRQDGQHVPRAEGHLQPGGSAADATRSARRRGRRAGWCPRGGDSAHAIAGAAVGLPASRLFRRAPGETARLRGGGVGGEGEGAVRRART